MPRIAHESKNEKEFMEKLYALMDTAKESLEIKRKVLEQLTENNLYPYTKHYLSEIRKLNGSYWKNHFSTIGLVGMNEAVIMLTGENIGTEKGVKAAEKIMDKMRDRMSDYQEETGNNYNLEATPAESTSYRLALLDQKKYNDIVFANGIGKEAKDPFYTNSTHLPVNFSHDMFEILDLQDDLQTKYTGGTVIHFFLGERIDNPESVKTLVKKICENYHLPYFTLSPTFSICSTHGYIHGESKTCPTCSMTCEVYTRVVGYLRPVDSWNNGKQAEYALRSHVDAKEISNACETIVLEKTVSQKKK